MFSLGDRHKLLICKQALTVLRHCLFVTLEMKKLGRLNFPRILGSLQGRANQLLVNFSPLWRQSQTSLRKFIGLCFFLNAGEQRHNSRLGVTKYSEFYEIVHSTLDLVLMCVFTGVGYGTECLLKVLQRNSPNK